MKKAFTLLELTIVVTIIGGLLAGVVSKTARSLASRSRDNKRMADITAIQVGLERFYTKHRVYPHFLYAGSCDGLTDARYQLDSSFLARVDSACTPANGNPDFNQPTERVAPNFLTNIPTPPRGTTGPDNGGDRYRYATAKPAGDFASALRSNQHYVLCTTLENTSLIPPGNQFNTNSHFIYSTLNQDSNTPACNYQVHSAGWD